MKNVLLVLVLASLAACGGGGGSSQVDDVKPAAITSCEAWEDQGDGTEARSCKETVSGVTTRKWTETRDIPGEACDGVVFEVPGIPEFCTQYVGRTGGTDIYSDLSFSEMINKMVDNCYVAVRMSYIGSEVRVVYPNPTGMNSSGDSCDSGE